VSGPAPEAPRGGPAARAREDSIDPLDVLVLLGRARRQLILWPLLAAVLAAGVSMVLPKRYTASARILPPQQAQSSATALLSQLGGLGGVAGGALGLKSPGDLHVGMLKSRTVADALVEQFSLKAHYGQELLVDARQALADATRIQADKSGIIGIDVEARTPELAADLANGYVAQLHRLFSTLAVTEAAQRRVFFERHLLQTKDKLAEAEAELRAAMDTGGLVSVDAQSRAAMETVARLRAEIAAREIQLEVMRGYATAANPDRRRAEQEVASMRQALARMESGQEGAEVAQPGGAKGGARGLANIRLLREVKYQEVMMELLARQFELARVDESKEAPIIQVLDAAQPPEKRSWPKRTLIVVVSATVALFAAALAALVRGALAASSGNPERQAKLAAVRSAWGRRGS
jgi:uncharacterized protein involved in exopolysaccharide biosynthesis